MLKVHNAALPSGSVQRLEAQNRFIARLHEQGLPVPEVVEAPDGQSIIPWEAAAAEGPTPLARMLTYLEGEIVPNEAPKDEAFLEGVGSLAGRVSTALAGFEDPAAQWTWDWDMKRVHEVVRGKLGFIKDPARRELATRLAAEYEAALGGGRADALPHSVIHADLNDTNLLYQDGRVVGILDFGDSIHSCTAFEPAIAAGYYSLGQAQPMKVFCQVLRGYQGSGPRALTGAELAAYFHAARGRVLLSVACSAEYSSLEPDNEYLAHTSEPGWAVLEKLGGVDLAAALAELERACSS